MGIIAPSIPASYPDLLRAAAGRWPDRDALVFTDDRLTYSELLSRSQRRARELAGLGGQAPATMSGC